MDLIGLWFVALVLHLKLKICHTLTQTHTYTYTFTHLIIEAVHYQTAAQ